MATLSYASSRSPSSSSRRTASDALWVTYRWMTLGVAVTGAVAFAVSRSPSMTTTIVDNPLFFYGALIVQLLMVVAFGRVASRASTPVAASMFFAYAALTGVTFSVLFLLYTATSIATTFFVTAGAFAALSAFGAVTRRDLSAIGRFGIFVLVGVVLATLANIFVRSGTLELVISIVGVVLFGALTAYDTQRLERLFEQTGTAGNLPLVGALTLYLDFINMFLFTLRLFSGRASNG